MKVAAWSILAIVTMGAVGCASPMRAGADYEPGTTFNAYETFTFAEPDGLPVGDPRLENNPFYTDRLHRAIKTELERRGIREVSSSPGLIVHHHSAVRNQVDVYEADATAGYGTDRYGRGTQIVEYEEGTFLVDIADADSKEIVWRGWAIANVDHALSDPESMADLLGRAVALMFERYPVPPTG